MAAKIADAHATARNSVPGGTVVASLRQGEEVVQIAEHGKFVLCTFPDPKDATKRLEGWVADEAFKAGPTPPLPKTATCPGTQVHLISDENVFCGDVCKEDKDCPASAPKCTGHANSYVDGKEGPAVTTCTVAVVAAPIVSPPTMLGQVHAGVQTQPLPGGLCLATFALAPDKLCHKKCPTGNECPSGLACTKGVMPDGLAVCSAH